MLSAHYARMWICAYAFPPAAILGKVVKLRDYNMLEDHSDHSGVEKYALVLESSGNVQQITRSLPNLLTKHFNQIPHRNLTNLNIHAWHLEPHLLRSRVDLKHWQQELRLPKKDKPDQCMRLSGPVSKGTDLRFREVYPWNLPLVLQTADKGSIRTP